MRRDRKAVVGALLVLVSAACAESAGDESAPAEVADRADVPVAYTSIGSNSPMCTVGEERLRIGSVEGDDGTELFGVNDLAVLADGRIAVTSLGSPEVRVFSPDGSLLNEFGRQGDGPTEFKNVWSVFVRGGDTLVVGDYRPWRFSFFTPEGEFLRRVALSPSGMERPDFALPLESGAGFVMEEPVVAAQDEMVDRVIPLHVFGEDGAMADTVGHFWLDRYGYLAREVGFVGNPIFGARAAISPLREDLLVYGPGRYEQFEIWNTAGELLRIVRWESRDRAVEPGDADDWRRQLRAEFEEQFEITPEIESAIQMRIGDHLPVAEEYPGHDRIVVSDVGDIWVKDYRRPRDEGPDRWWVFGEEGEFVCTAPFPDDFFLHAVRNDRAFGVARDGLGVEYILGYDVTTPRTPAP